MTVVVDVWADIACPWCYLGAHRLERAVAGRPEGTVRVRWRAFELQPDLPPGGVEARPFFLAKFGSAATMEAAFARVAGQGAADGVVFDFAAMHRAPNTRLAHRAVVLAEQRGAGQEAADALFAGHFAHGADVADLDEVLRLLDDAGVPVDVAELRALLTAGAGLDRVVADERLAADLGVTGVPFFLAAGEGAAAAPPPGSMDAAAAPAFGDLSRAHAVSGAQPPAVLARLLDVAAAEAGADAGGPTALAPGLA